jgi:hypothetical protein
MTEALPAPVASGPASVEELLAHAKIQAVLVAYCQGVDRRDWDHLDNARRDRADLLYAPLEIPTATVGG